MLYIQRGSCKQFFSYINIEIVLSQLALFIVKRLCTGDKRIHLFIRYRFTMKCFAFLHFASTQSPLIALCQSANLRKKQLWTCLWKFLVMLNGKLCGPTPHVKCKKVDIKQGQHTVICLTPSVSWTKVYVSPHLQLCTSDNMSIPFISQSFYVQFLFCRVGM